MNEDFDNYFSGALSDKEKRDFIERVASDETAKAEFIRMQQTVALSQLHTQKGDAAFASEMLYELDKTVRFKARRRIWWNMTKYAAVIAVLVINSWLLWDKFNPSEEELAYTVIEVPKGQRISMTLTDGTVAWLSPRSTLRIPNQFNKKERTVELDGEGYFTVTKDAQKPFFVKTGSHQVKVLGTRFNVFAYSKSKRFQTDLLEGRVEVADIRYPENVVQLQPGEKVMLENDRLVKSISHFNNEDYLKNGVFNFTNKPFGEILEYLTLWYDMTFDVKDPVKKEFPISGKFRQSDEVKNILKALQGVHAFKYTEIDEQNITIYE